MMMMAVAASRANAVKNIIWYESMTLCREGLGDEPADETRGM